MKLTKNKLTRLVEAELKNHHLEEGALGDLAGRAVSSLKRTLDIPMVAKSVDRLKGILAGQGDAGDAARREEVVSILNALGIKYADLVKIMGTARADAQDAKISKQRAPTSVPGTSSADPLSR